MIDIQSVTAEAIARKEEEERRRRRRDHGEKYHGLPYYIGRP